MGLMGADWHTMGDSYTEAASEAVVASFGVAVQRRGGSGGGGSAQAVANVIYSLGTLHFVHLSALIIFDTELFFYNLTIFSALHLFGMSLY